MNLDIFGHNVFVFSCIIWKYAFVAYAESEVPDQIARSCSLATIFAVRL